MNVENLGAASGLPSSRPISWGAKRFPIKPLMLGCLTVAATLSFARTSNAAVTGKMTVRNNTNQVVYVDIALDSKDYRDFDNYATLSPGQSVTIAMNHPDVEVAYIEAEYKDAAGSWHFDWGPAYFANDPDDYVAWTWNVGAPDSDPIDGVQGVVGVKG